MIDLPPDLFDRLSRSVDDYEEDLISELEFGINTLGEFIDSAANITEKQRQSLQTTILFFVLCPDAADIVVKGVLLARYEMLSTAVDAAGEKDDAGKA